VGSVKQQFDNLQGNIMAHFKKPLAAALGAAFLATSVAPLAGAAVNPFSSKQLSGGYDLPSYNEPQGEKAKEGSCGDKAKEGSCGDKAKEGSCGDKAKEGSCGDKAKAKEGSCGDKAEKKAGEGKCGEGKCGGS
jgi:uncharacterized low-complexity protein